MKKIYFIFVCIFAMQMFITCDKERVIQETQLPQPSRDFLTAHFPSVSVTFVTKEWDDYDVLLSNGFQVGFDRKGNWDQVNGITQSVPQSVIDLIPEAVPAYISAHFPDTVIVEINKERFGYEIDLSNGLDLEFNSTGNIRNIDD